MEDKNQYFRCLMLFYFRKGKNATQTKKKICEVYGESAVSERVCQNWFQKFRAGDTTCEAGERSGRPLVTESEQIEGLIKKNPYYTTREIAVIVNVSQKTISNHLLKMGYVSRYDIWVPHHLNEKSLIDRISICSSLLKRNQESPFLKRIITGDEKWILYNNVQRKRSWGKPGEQPPTTAVKKFHPKKVMLCIWWDWKGIIYYELIKQNETIDSIKYCAQLDRLKAAIDEKRPRLSNKYGVIFQQDNARPHVSLQTRQKLLQFGWDVLSHPAYSPDLAPSEFYLFRSLQNSLNGKNFSSLEDCQKHLEEFIDLKSEKFWKDGIFKLPDRWQNVVDLNGAYIVE